MQRAAEPPPVAVTASTAGWLVVAALGLLATAANLASLDGLQDALQVVVERDFPAEAPTIGNRAVALATGVIIGGGLAIPLLQGVAGVALRSRRRGARTALVSLGLAAGLLTLLAAGVTGPLVTAAMLLQLAVALGSAVAMYSPAARRWFATAPV